MTHAVPKPWSRRLLLFFLALMACGWGVAIVWLDYAQSPDVLLIAALLFVVILVISLALLKHFDLFVWIYIIIVPLTFQVPHHNLISDGLTLLLVGLYMTRKLTAGQISILRPPRSLALALGIYLLSVLLSALQSDFALIGLRQLVREILFFGIIYCLYDWMRSDTQWFLAVKGLAWLGVAIAVSIVIAALMGRTVGDLRSAGLFNSPTRAALVLTTVFPSTIGYLRGRIARGAPVANSLLLGYATLGVLAALLTGSRNALLIVLLALVLLFWQTWRKHAHALAILLPILAILAAGTLWVTGSADTISQRFRFDRGLSGRPLLWSRAWSTFKAHPLLGTGPSTFRYYAVEPQYLEPYGTVEEIVAQAGAGVLPSGAYWVPGLFGGIVGNSTHNILLGALSNTGIIGFGAAINLLITITVIGARAMRQIHQKQRGLIDWTIYGCWITLIVTFIKLQFEEGIFKGSVSTTLPFWLTVVLLAHSIAIMQDKQSVAHDIEQTMES